MNPRPHATVRPSHGWPRAFARGPYEPPAGRRRGAQVFDAIVSAETVQTVSKTPLAALDQALARQALRRAPPATNATTAAATTTPVPRRLHSIPLEAAPKPSLLRPPAALLAPRVSLTGVSPRRGWEVVGGVGAGGSPPVPYLKPATLDPSLLTEVPPGPARPPPRPLPAAHGRREEPRHAGTSPPRPLLAPRPPRSCSAPRPPPRPESRASRGGRPSPAAPGARGPERGGWRRV